MYSAFYYWWRLKRRMWRAVVLAIRAAVVVSLLLFLAWLLLSWYWPEAGVEVRRFVIRTGNVVLQVTGRSLRWLGESLEGQVRISTGDETEMHPRSKSPKSDEEPGEVFRGPPVVDASGNGSGDRWRHAGVERGACSPPRHRCAGECPDVHRRWKALALRAAGGFGTCATDLRSVGCLQGKGSGRLRGAWWQCAGRAARTLTPGWYRRDGRWHTGGILWTMWTRRLRQEQRGGAFGAAGSWSHGIGARESAWILTRRPSSGTGAGLPARELADAASRGTSAARALASITCRVAGTTRARASVRPRVNAGSARRPKPERRVGGGHGGDGIGTLVMQIAEKGGSVQSAASAFPPDLGIRRPP